MKNSNAFGIWAEQLAQRYLQQQGFTLLTQGYCCRYGEIDLIMVNAEQLIFVEVKARASTTFGEASESISFNKRTNASHLSNGLLCRIGVDVDQSAERAQTRTT